MQDELMDRFGDIPKPVENLLRVAGIKALAHSAYVTEVNINSQEIRLTMYQKAKLTCGRYTGYGGSVPRGFEVPYGRRTVFYVH